MRKQMSIWAVAGYMLSGCGVGCALALVIYMFNIGPDWIGESFMVMGIAAGVLLGCAEYEKDKKLFAETEIDDGDWPGMKEHVKDVLIAFKYPSEYCFHPFAISIFATNKWGASGETRGAFVDSTNLRTEISLFEGSIEQLNKSTGNDVLKNQFSWSYADGQEDGRCVAYIYKDRYVNNKRMQRYVKKLSEAIEKSLPYNGLDLDVKTGKSSIYISSK